MPLNEALRVDSVLLCFGVRTCVRVFRVHVALHPHQHWVILSLRSEIFLCVFFTHCLTEFSVKLFSVNALL